MYVTSTYDKLYKAMGLFHYNYCITKQSYETINNLSIAVAVLDFCGMCCIINYRSINSDQTLYSCVIITVDVVAGTAAVIIATEG